MNKWFTESIVVSLFALAGLFGSWAFAACAVIMVLGLEALQNFAPKKEDKQLAELRAEHEKLSASFQNLVSEVGKVGYKVNSLSTYMGAPGE